MQEGTIARTFLIHPVWKQTAYHFLFILNWPDISFFGGL